MKFVRLNTLYYIMLIYFTTSNETSSLWCGYWDNKYNFENVKQLKL